MVCLIDKPVGISGATDASSFLSPPYKTGWRRRGKKAELRVKSADFLDKLFASFTGYIAVDELYDGPFCYLSLVDQHQQRRLLYEVLNHTPTQQDITVFLQRFQQEIQKRDLVLRGITTDGSPLYPEAVAEVFPEATHQICRFHLIKEILSAVIHTLAKIRKTLRGSIPKRPRGRPSFKNKRLHRRIERLQKRHAELFEHRYLFVRRQLTPAQRRTLQRISRPFPELKVLRDIVEQVYQLFDRRCRTATALEKLHQLRKRVHRFRKLRVSLRKIDSPTFEKALCYLDDRDLPGTSNAVERGNRRHRKMQKSVYRIRTQAGISGRIGLDMLREGFRIHQIALIAVLHHVRAG